MILQMIIIVCFLKEYFIELIHAYNKLFHDGYIVINDFLHNDDIRRIIHFLNNEYYEQLKTFLMTERFQNKLKLSLLNRYENQDAFLYEICNYTYVLNGSNINSWHRDFTSSKIFNNLKYPAYSVIIYLTESSLDVIPSSHENDKSIYFCYKSFKTLNLNKGDAIIFDSDLFHKGSDAGKIAIQLKLVHRKDIERLPHLDNYLEVNNNECNSPSLFNKYFNETIKYVPFIIDLNYRIIIDCFSRKTNIIHKIVSFMLFGKSNYF